MKSLVGGQAFKNAPDVSHVPEIEEPAKDTALVRFPPLLVRRHTSHQLMALLLALPPRLAGTALTVTWRATARNTLGQRQGESELCIPATDKASETTYDGVG